MTSAKIGELERRLWSATDNLRANSDLKASEYSTPVLGLIFLKFAATRYKRFESEILKELAELKCGRGEKRIFGVSCDVASTLHPAFDMTWNGCRYLRSPNFDLNGDWELFA